MSAHDSPGVRDIVLVMGMTGWGKSWWTKLYSQGFPRLVVYDPFASFPCDAYLPIEELVEHLIGNQPAKTFRFGLIEGDHVPQAASACYIAQSTMFIVEECATIFEKGLARLPEWGKRHCFLGRHRSCSIVLIAQRPTYIPIDFRSQANRVITFCQHEDTDMDWLQGFFGKERMGRMLSLPKFSCFDWQNGIVKEYSIVDQVQNVFGVSLDIHRQDAVDLVL